MKIDADEKKLLESVERGEWKSAGGGKRERSRFARDRLGAACGRVGRIEIRAFLALGPVGLPRRQAEDE